MYTEDITLEFINKYKELENLRNTNFSVYDFLKNKNHDLYEEFRNTRNVLAHNINNDGKYPILVSKELLDNLKHQITLLTKNLNAVMTYVSKITASHLDTPLYKVIDFMNRKNISHVPVLTNSGIVSHVVSFNSIISILSNNKGSIVYDNNTTINDYKNYFEIANNNDEYYLFMASNELAYVAKQKMKERINNKKCGIIFVTDNGSQTGKLIGVVTSYDLMKI